MQTLTAHYKNVLSEKILSRFIFSLLACTGSKEIFWWIWNMKEKPSLLAHYFLVVLCLSLFLPHLFLVVKVWTKSELKNLGKPRKLSFCTKGICWAHWFLQNLENENLWILSISQVCSKLIKSLCKKTYSSSRFTGSNTGLRNFLII